MSKAVRHLRNDYRAVWFTTRQLSELNRSLDKHLSELEQTPGRQAFLDWRAAESALHQVDAALERAAAEDETRRKS